MAAGIEQITGRNLKQESLKRALSGLGIFHADPTFFAPSSQNDIGQRTQKYRELHQAYQGDHVLQDEEDRGFVNLCRLTVQKSNDWLFGKPWTLAPTNPANTDITERVVEVWEDNDKDLLCMLLGNSGGIFGDAYLYVTLDDMGGKLPLEEAKIKINWIKAPYCHPIFDPLDPGKMLACLVQYPVAARPEGNQLVLNAHGPFGGGRANEGIFSIYFTKGMIQEYLDDQLLRSYTNIFGRIPIFHGQNIISSHGWAGESDLEDLWQLNRQANRALIRMIQSVMYNADPTTLITGVDGKDELFKGKGSLITTKNPNAKAYTLPNTGSEAGAVELLRTVLDACYLVAGVPKSTLGDTGSLANTKSGVMELVSLPLMEKTRRKRITYGKLIASVSAFIAELLFAQKPSAVERNNYLDSYNRFKVVFGEPLPRNESEQLESIIKRVNNALLSRAGALRELGEQNLPQTALEIIADQRHAHLADIEKARGLEGDVPNLAVYRTSSLAMLVEDDKLWAEEDELAEQYMGAKSEQKERDAEVAAAAVPPVKEAPQSSAFKLKAEDKEKEDKKEKD